MTRWWRARTLGLTTPSGRPRGSGARWRGKEDALLRLHAGLNPAALAVRLGRSDQAVVARLRSLGPRNGPPMRVLSFDARSERSSRGR
jgi:hypothetical protein